MNERIPDLEQLLARSEEVLERLSQLDRDELIEVPNELVELLEAPTHVTNPTPTIWMAHRA